MIFLLIIFCLAVVVSLFFVSWRIAIWAIAVEALMTGFILIRFEDLDSWAVRIQILDLLLFRSLIIPIYLIGVLQKFQMPTQINGQTNDEFNTIPPNFIIWTMALALWIGSFTLGHSIFPSELQSALHFGTAIATILIGLFILSNQSSPVGQIIGLLTFESGIILSELMPSHHEQWPIQLGLSVIFLWSVRLSWKFLQYFSSLENSSFEVPELLMDEEKDVL